ncbi:MAG: cytochrome c [Chloroflexi bacterium]|nr:cytochrome c [Chloroflexota bacterium]
MMRMIGPLLLLTVVLTACVGDAPSSIAYADVPLVGDVSRGEVLYNEPINGIASCLSCHQPGAVAAPVLDGYAALAAERVAGESAHEYTFYAIAEPARHIVEGYGNVMPNTYDEALSPQEMADLIAYLLSL